MGKLVLGKEQDLQEIVKAQLPTFIKSGKVQKLPISIEKRKARKAKKPKAIQLFNSTHNHVSYKTGLEEFPYFKDLSDSEKEFLNKFCFETFWASFQVSDPNYVPFYSSKAEQKLIGKEVYAARMCILNLTNTMREDEYRAFLIKQSLLNKGYSEERTEGDLDNSYNNDYFEELMNFL